MGGPTFPLILPEEIWEMILGLLENSEDVSNLITAIPELRSLLKNKGPLWLFDQAIPHIDYWLKRNELLACRQTCVRWSRGVDKFIDEHPSFATHNLENPSSIPMEFSRDNGDHFGVGGADFRSPGRITAFRRDMEAHPPERNPFVGRSLCYEPGVEGVDLDLDLFREEGQSLLWEFGRHLHLLDLIDHEDEDPRWYCRWVLNGLQHLPNLRHLYLRGGDSNLFMDDPRSFVNRSIRAVNRFVQGGGVVTCPQLHCLDVDVESCPPALVKFLVAAFAPQLRKLCLPLCYWKKDYPSLFPNLKDFSLKECNLPKVLRDLFQGIDAPQLSHLGVALEGEKKYVLDRDIFPWLKRQPRLQSLELRSDEGGVLILEDGSLSPARDSMPSLKSLTIYANNRWFQYNFLLCFPSLEYLVIYDDPSRGGRFQSPFQSKVKLQEFIRSGTLYDSNVWELLPQLRGIKIKSMDPASTVPSRFTRETYEDLKTGSGSGSRVVNGSTQRIFISNLFLAN